MEFKFIIYFGIFFGYLKFSESIDCSVKDHKTAELRLKHDLLCEYDAEERPISKNGTLVKIRLFIKKFDYYGYRSKIAIESWLGMTWNDDRLKWNLKDYDNLDDIVIEGDSIWMPDLAVYNSGDTSQFHQTCKVAPCHVTDKGEVTCMPPCSHKGECETDFTNWPFDNQICSLHLGSWLHKGNVLRFEEARTVINIEDVKHNEWKITNISYKNNVGVYKCCPNDTFPSVSYKFDLQRHSDISKTFVVPPIVILSFLNLAILWINPNCSERIILIFITISLHFLHLQHLVIRLPRSGANVPRILLFFRDSLVISSGILLETLIMRCLLLCQKSSPEWIKSSAQLLRSHKMGQLMFENPYIINRSDYSRQITINSWLSMKWLDDRLKWNSKDYDNLKEIIIKSEDIWMPPLSIYNSDETQFHETCTSADCTISYTGMVGCIPPCAHSAECETNAANWPYDIQNCTLHFGSWMNKGKEISFIEERTVIDRSKLQHNEFNIIKITHKNIPGNYVCCPDDTFPSVKYNIILERHSGPEACYISAPAIILAFLNLSTLWLNPICAERMLVICVTMISHFLYAQHLSWQIPKNGEIVPLVLLYFKDSLIFSAVLLLETLLMRGLLLCQKSSPVWVKTAAQSLRGNKVGQYMFENPYIINKGTFDMNGGDDGANLVEGQNHEQVTVGGSEKLEEKEVWFSTVKIIDTLLFFILLICYIVMLSAWLPNSKIISIDEKSVDIQNDTSTK